MNIIQCFLTSLNWRGIVTPWGWTLKATVLGGQSFEYWFKAFNLENLLNVYYYVPHDDYFGDVFFGGGGLKKYLLWLNYAEICVHEHNVNCTGCYFDIIAMKKVNVYTYNDYTRLQKIFTHEHDHS